MTSAIASAIATGIPIDPVLLLPEEVSPFNPETGALRPKADVEVILNSCTRKDPLRVACQQLSIRVTSRATLAALRAALLQHWFPSTPPSSSSRVSPQSPNAIHARPPNPTPSLHNDTVPDTAQDEDNDDGSLDSVSSSPAIVQDMIRNARNAIDAAASGTTTTIADISFEEADLDVIDTSGQTDDLLLSQINRLVGGLEDDGEDEEFRAGLEDDANFSQFQLGIRVFAANRTEANRRAGGLKTHKANLSCWNRFVKWAVSRKLIRDAIVDEHSMLMYAIYTSQRCRRNTRGEDIPNTRVGASQIKKEMFGAIRLRKIQEAKNPSLKTTRPAATVYVYDVYRTLMDEALKRNYEGLIDGEDAPDLVANTFLDRVTDETLEAIGRGFLAHREVKCAIMGHLAWVITHATGCRGDDVRALKICELQSYQLHHPSYHTPIPGVLLVQSQHKAQQHKMKTAINPVYSTLIAHRDPCMCPLGALSIWLYYLFDNVGIITKYGINFSVNKSWRGLSLLHGSSAAVPYSDSSLINLFGQSYKSAGVSCRLKQHLARHMLGYKQDTLGVDKAETSKMGWSRDTYGDVYAPAFPKRAILAAHGFQAHEEYRVMWTEIEVPEVFLTRIFPFAESYLSQVKGQTGLVGATNFLSMLISLRPIFFQCAAGIYQTSPNSALFRLPVLSTPDVQEWIKHKFTPAYTLMKQDPSTCVDLAKISESTTCLAFVEMREYAARSFHAFNSLSDKVDRRTAAFSPSNTSFAGASSHLSMFAPRQLEFPESATSSYLSPSPHLHLHVSPLEPPLEIVPPPSDIIATSPHFAVLEDAGIYVSSDGSLRAYVLPAPPSPGRRVQAPLDLVLPPLLAFCKPGDDPVHPIFCRDGADWPAVFKAIKQPGVLWNAWRPTRSLDSTSIDDVWSCYTHGEKVYDMNKVQTGVKPPLRLVENVFGASWRRDASARKFWSRLRVIPEWIETSSLTPNSAIQALEGKRLIPGKVTKLGTHALSELLEKERKAVESGAPKRRAPKTIHSDSMKKSKHN